MTRAYVPVHQFLDLVKSEIGKATESEVNLTDFDYGDKNKPIDMACRLVRWFTPEAVRAYRLIVDTMTNMAGGSVYTEKVSKHLKGSFPLFMFGKGPKDMVVFTNIVTTNLMEGEEHSNAGSFCHRYVFVDGTLKEFIDRLGKELAHPPTAKGWIGPGRAWKKLRRQQNVDISYVLNSVLNLRDVMPEKVVAALAEAIEDVRKPLELTYAEKPADYIDMYSNGPESCMSAKNNGSWPHLIKANHNPPSFWAYFPHAKGVYVKKAGRVMARAMIYETKPGTWAHGKIYASSSQMNTNFKEAMRITGITPLLDGAYRGLPDKEKELTFNIPVIYSGSTPTVPIPFMDNFRGRIDVRMLDKDTAEVKIGTGGGTGNGNGVGAHGSLRLDGVTTACAHCGGRVPPNTHRRIDAREYCSERCANAGGYVSARNVEGLHVLVHPDDVFKDYWGMERYTTAEAAARHNCFPVRESIYYAEEEEDLLSRNGMLIELNGDIIALEPNEYKAHVGSRSLGKTGYYDFTNSPDISKIPARLFHSDIRKKVEYREDDPLYEADGPTPEVTIEVTEKEDLPKVLKGKKARAVTYDEDDWFSVTSVDDMDNQPTPRVRY